MKRKITAIIAAAAIAAAGLSAHGATPIEELKDKGVINGFEDGKLHEEYNLTRAQAITIIMRSTGFDDSKWYKAEIKKFDDMPISHWASGYVYKGVSLDMVDGVSETEYLPERNVTYEQAVKLLVCLLGYEEEGFVYPDDYLKKAAEIDMLKGVTAKIGDELTRGDFAALVYNAINCAGADGTKLVDALDAELIDEYDDYDDYYPAAAGAVADGVAISESAAEPALARGGGAKAAASASTADVADDVFIPGVPDLDDPDIDYPDQITPGQLTAGRWSDFENYSFWENLMQNQEYSELQSKWEVPIDISKVSPDPDESEDILDLMFTIDTTGSMGDELRYIKEELKDVVIRLDTNVRLSCNYYRDTTDSYTVKSFPFTTNVDKVVSQISRQYASGGGDYPEAVDLALLDSIDEHDWSVSARSRLLFLVLDAPPHFTDEVVLNIRNAVNSAVAKGIHIVPVASSGVDKDTEFFLRSLALATGGTYVFLTDHSGIGYSHIEPTIGDYDVEYLNELLLNIIKQYIVQDYDIQIDDPEPTDEPEPTNEPEPTDEPEPTIEPEPTDEP
ncbi:MAG: VWA domain-containing protein, partial [Clostridia bacterium]|nr:VWA domain-containing protein [Clostridia bacterium]